MTFHSDVDTGDMLSMFVQSLAFEGGDQHVASIASIYNHLIVTDHNVIKLLSNNRYRERAHR